MLTATGSGFSRWNGLSVSRWKADPTEDRNGTFIFLRDTASGEWWSTTAAPRRAAEEKTRVVFSDDKAEFTKTVGDITSTVECVVATEHDAEGRRVTLLNTGTEDRFIEVTSYMEPVLSSDDNDNAHPVFSRMFVKTELGRKGDVIRIERNKRSPSDPDICVAHLVSDTSGPGRNTEFETDRYKFIGRGRTLPRLRPSIQMRFCRVPTGLRSIQSPASAACCAFPPAKGQRGLLDHCRPEPPGSRCGHRALSSSRCVQP